MRAVVEAILPRCTKVSPQLRNYLFSPQAHMAAVSQVLFLKPQPGRLEAFMRDLSKANNIIKRAGGKLFVPGTRCRTERRHRRCGGRA
jgi:hypothetical protein